MTFDDQPARRHGFEIEMHWSGDSHSTASPKVTQVAPVTAQPDGTTEGPDWAVFALDGGLTNEQTTHAIQIPLFDLDLFN